MGSLVLPQGLAGGAEERVLGLQLLTQASKLVLEAEAEAVVLLATLAVREAQGVQAQQPIQLHSIAYQ